MLTINLVSPFIILLITWFKNSTFVKYMQELFSKNVNYFYQSCKFHGKAIKTKP